jgi:hypothetical protein
MLWKVADDGGRNGRHPQVDIVFIGGDEQTLEKVIQSTRLCCPLASMVSIATSAAGLELVQGASPDRQGLWHGYRFVGPGLASPKPLHSN